MNVWTSSRARWSAPAIVLLGCATTGTESYDSMRAEADRGVADDRQQAEDDAALNGPVLDRAAYVRAVLHRSRSIESARQAWRAAIARVRQSGAFDDPMVTLEVAPLSIGSSSARFGWTGMVSQRLPWPGKLSLEETVSKAEADAQRCDYEAARRELALTASLLYDDYFVAVRSIEINAHHVELMRSMHARGHRAVRGGSRGGAGSAAGRVRAHAHGARHGHSRFAARRDRGADERAAAPGPGASAASAAEGAADAADVQTSPRPDGWRARRSIAAPTSRARGSTRAPRRPGRSARSASRTRT